MKLLHKNWLEWSVFGISSLLVAGVLGYLAWTAATASDSPASLEVELGQPERRSGHYAVPVKVTNRGNESAQAVHVEVSLQPGSGPMERAYFDLEFVPRHGTRRGWVSFRSDPSEAESLTARPIGFEAP